MQGQTCRDCNRIDGRLRDWGLEHLSGAPALALDKIHSPDLCFLFCAWKVATTKPARSASDRAEYLTNLCKVCGLEINFSKTRQSLSSAVRTWQETRYTIKEGGTSEGWGTGVWVLGHQYQRASQKCCEVLLLCSLGDTIFCMCMEAACSLL